MTHKSFELAEKVTEKVVTPLAQKGICMASRPLPLHKIDDMAAQGLQTLENKMPMINKEPQAVKPIRIPLFGDSLLHFAFIWLLFQYIADGVRRYWSSVPETLCNEGKSNESFGCRTCFSTSPNVLRSAGICFIYSYQNFGQGASSSGRSTT